MDGLTRRKFLEGGVGLLLMPTFSRGDDLPPAIGSDLLHWDGQRWHAAGQFREQLLAVDVFNSRYGWAVGKNGAVLHFDGSGWTPLKGPAGDLHSVVCLSGDEAWMAGESLWRIEGKSWRKYDNPTEHSRTLYEIAFGNGGGWAVGVRGALARFDGRQWTAQTVPVPNDALMGLSIAGDSDVWAVGERGRIARFNGRAWRPVPGPADPAWAATYLHDVHFLSPDNGWAVGAQGTIIHYDGRVWSLVESPTGKFLLAAHFNAPDDGWAAGGNFPDGAVVLHYDGNKWSEVAGPTMRPVQDLCFVSPTSGWAVASSVKPVTTQR